jgi:hypothetical protein
MGKRLLPKNDHAWRAELTDRQARFCEQYLIDLNATEAALRVKTSCSRRSIARP